MRDTVALQSDGFHAALFFNCFFVLFLLFSPRLDIDMFLIICVFFHVDKLTKR